MVMLALLLAIRVVLALPASGSDYEPRFPPLPSPALLHALLPSGRDTVFWINQVLEVLLQPRAQDSIAIPHTASNSAYSCASEDAGADKFHSAAVGRTLSPRTKRGQRLELG